jgi:hypothetical protein
MEHRGHGNEKYIRSPIHGLLKGLTDLHPQADLHLLATYCVRIKPPYSSCVHILKVTNATFSHRTTANNEKVHRGTSLLLGSVDWRRQTL